MTENGGRRRDAERTRALLLAEATAAFAETGYSGTGVDEIARRSGTTKRMIYYYFGSKEGLYLAMLEQAYRGIREAEQQLQVDGIEPVEALRRLAEITFDHHLEHDEFVRLVAIENIHRGRFIKQLDSLRDLSAPALDILDQLLQRGREQGLFRDDVTALDVHLLISSYCVFQVANQYTFGHLFGPEQQTPARRAQLRSMIGDIVVTWLTAPAK
ncbi:MAG: TetR/AcrR family transcriptional regulator [Leucobacter sp.]